MAVINTYYSHLTAKNADCIMKGGESHEEV